MRLVALLALMLLVGCVRFSPSDDDIGSKATNLTIYSTTDSSVFEPVIEDFNRIYPKVRVHYIELDTTSLYQRFLAETQKRKPRADLLLSSAMDLQVKLVNDGFAAPHHSANASALPPWAQWRSEALGFTFEPAVMVFNTRLMAGRKIPRSRPELIAALRRDPSFWHGRVGSYDASVSSVGYLLMSEDARQSSDFGPLMQALGDAGMKVADHTGTLLDEIERGDLVMGYNLLESYAEARVAHGAPLVIIYPDDYTLAVTRTAIVPKNAPHPGAAHAFLEYLLSLRGQRILTDRGHLGAVREEIQGPFSRMGITEATVGPLRPIGLGPGLLVYLDAQKHQRLLQNWRAMIIQPSSGRSVHLTGE